MSDVDVFGMEISTVEAMFVEPVGNCEVACVVDLA